MGGDRRAYVYPVVEEIPAKCEAGALRVAAEEPAHHIVDAVDVQPSAQVRHQGIQIFTSKQQTGEAKRQPDGRPARAMVGLGL